MTRLFPALLVAVLGLAGLGVTCPTQTPEISRERATAIAQAQVSFEIDSVDAERITEEGRRAWRVTFRGKPVSPDHPLLRPIVIVVVDARTGEVISIAKS